MRIQAAQAAVLACASAELAVRLLAPRPFTRALASAPAADHFQPAEIRRAKRYARGRAVLEGASAAAELALLVALVARARQRAARCDPTRGGAGVAGARVPEAAGAGEPEAASGAGPVDVARGAAAGAGLALAGTLVALPIAALARMHGRAYGLVTQSWRGWLADLVRATAIEAFFAALAGGGAVALMRRWPRKWWAAAAGIWWTFAAALTALSPVLLDPIFNDFQPLEDAALRGRVLELARRAGVRVGSVLRVDASRRTSAANAYVAGLGPTKRVVLFDTLLDRYSPEEVAVVVAHELAHVRHRDVLRALAFTALTAAPATRAVQRIATALAPTAEGSVCALPALALAGAASGVLLAPSSSRLSRAVERRADSFALELSGAPQAFISFQRRIALQNLADPRPARLRALLTSHPPVLERIAMAQQASGGRLPTGRRPPTGHPGPRRRTRAGS